MIQTGNSGGRRASVGGRSRRGSPYGQGPHVTHLEKILWGTAALRSGWPVSQSNACATHCLGGAGEKRRLRRLKGRVTLGLVIACLGFHYLEKLKKKDSIFFFYLIFMHFTVVRNYKIFGNFDSGSVGQVIGPGSCSQWPPRRERPAALLR